MKSVNRRTPDHFASRFQSDNERNVKVFLALLYLTFWGSFCVLESYGALRDDSDHQDGGWMKDDKCFDSGSSIVTLFSARSTACSF